MATAFGSRPPWSSLHGLGEDSTASLNIRVLRPKIEWFRLRCSLHHKSCIETKYLRVYRVVLYHLTPSLAGIKLFAFCSLRWICFLFALSTRKLRSEPPQAMSAPCAAASSPSFSIVSWLKQHDEFAYNPQNSNQASLEGDQIWVKIWYYVRWSPRWCHTLNGVRFNLCESLDCILDPRGFWNGRFRGFVSVLVAQVLEIEHAEAGFGFVGESGRDGNNKKTTPIVLILLMDKILHHLGWLKPL